ncbi:UbiH/UbiF/VisC/COQ6 family ubiquinone biosynthesis hydroxylase [Hydrogenovibrio kuenenii]|uniref:UbiH/UbiF/VisC/COQ6 family ubiquinone biosynthesis hydroxylase n=1 Tax=Hydrogenovibrio kuenenii TaxID=63658 RepID=UPI0004656189|nr:UbiH/UbiF/VisC/COQ6 family ubiquinone biosynthesis hydroxylase [Hydrogenovibrio kuenenii]
MAKTKQVKNQYNQSEDSLYDVAVVGGGMVGATVALGLAKGGFKVALIEKSRPSLEWQSSDSFETRVSALTRASENILKSLGAWPGILSKRYHAFTDMHVWEDISNAQVHFAAKDIEESNLGFVVENKVIQIALWEQLLEQQNVTILTDGLLASIQVAVQPGGISSTYLEFDNGNTIQASLVVGADGAFSKVRQMSGIGLESHDYEQCAVVGCVETELSHQNTCWQRYREEGPFAYLCMNGNISSIAWYMPVEKMDWAMSLDDKAFAEEVEKASGGCLGRVISVNKRDAFPLTRRHALEYVKPGIALVGDAAHTIHPQAGQGVNLGLLDAAALIETLVNAKQENAVSWSRFSVLRRYERWRKGDNQIVQRSMEGFDWLFEQDNNAKNAVRKALLPMANRMQAAKNWLMSQALKGRHALPELARD